MHIYIYIIYTGWVKKKHTPSRNLITWERINKFSRNFPELKLRYFDISVPNLVEKYSPFPKIWPFEQKVRFFKVNNTVETHNNGLRHLFDKISNQFYKSYVLQVYRQKRNVFYVYFVAGDTKHLFYSIAYAFPLIKMRSEYWKSLKFAPEQLVTCNKTHFTILCNKVCIVGIAFVLMNLRNIILVKLVADFVKKMT